MVTELAKLTRHGTPDRTRWPQAGLHCPRVGAYYQEVTPWPASGVTRSRSWGTKTRCGLCSTAGRWSIAANTSAQEF
ncbi:MAG: hypothetical protein Q9O62_06950 [Ardenticatenia bacterium]|nr:hypothetical protein [Ardenticatenia bacterium]